MLLVPAFGSWQGEEGRVPEECDGASPAGPAHGSAWAGCKQHRTPCAGQAGCPQAPPGRRALAKQLCVCSAPSAHNVHLALADRIKLSQGHLTPLELLTQGSPAENSTFEAWFEGIKHTLGLSFFLIACPGQALCLHSCCQILQQILVVHEVSPLLRAVKHRARTAYAGCRDLVLHLWSPAECCRELQRKDVCVAFPPQLCSSYRIADHALYFPFCYIFSLFLSKRKYSRSQLGLDWSVSPGSLPSPADLSSSILSLGHQGKKSGDLASSSLSRTAAEMDFLGRSDCDRRGFRENPLTTMLLCHFKNVRNVSSEHIHLLLI